jgi:hypothetical protein
MANKLLTIEEVSRQMLVDINRICDEEGIPVENRAELVCLALNPLMYSPSPKQDPH